jgi:cytochrome P450
MAKRWVLVKKLLCGMALPTEIQQSSLTLISLILKENNADKHLAFGIGRHTCIGKPVALMQLEESYKQILTRFPNIHMSGDWKVAPNNFVHAIQEMPVKF